MDNKLIMIILVFFVFKMLNKKSCGCKENFSSFYDTPSYETKVDCSDEPITFKKFLKNEKIKWVPIHKNQTATQKLYSTYRNKYADICPDSDYYAKFSYVM
jgi:hypothetical protein